MRKKEHIAKSLIIWDEDSKFELSGEGSSVIMSENDFEKTTHITFRDFSVIFILVELGWKSRTEFYGFTVAKILRLRYKLTCPIVFCSFLSEQQLYCFDDSVILRRPGHYFLRLPDDKPKEKYDCIDQDLLEDINEALFDPKKFIGEIVHSIPEALIKVVETEGNHNPEKALTVLENLLNPIKELFSSKGLNENFEAIENDLYKKLRETLKKPDFETYQLYRIIDSRNFSDSLPNNGNEDKPVWEPRTWQVLFIDDEKATCKKIKRLFETRKIKCHTADSASSAFDELKKDANGKNFISVIISDYRLFENGDSRADKWQKMQGLQILKHIYYDSDFKNYYSYVIFTQKGSIIKNEITKRQKFPMLWFNKGDVLGGGDHSFNIFCNRIIEIGEEAFNRNRPTPQTKTWTSGNSKVRPGLAFYYKLHLDSDDYQKSEDSMNAYVKSEIDYYKNSNKSEPKIEGSYIFQCTLEYLGDKRNERELLEKFRTNILVPRRIFWLLLLHYKQKGDDIIKIFNKQPNEKSTIFNTSLGLTDYKNLSANKNAMLFEEKKLLYEYSSPT